MMLGPSWYRPLLADGACFWWQHRGDAVLILLSHGLHFPSICLSAMWKSINVFKIIYKQVKNKYTLHSDWGGEDVCKNVTSVQSVCFNSHFTAGRCLWVGFMGTGATNVKLTSEFNTSFKCQIWVSAHSVLKGFRCCDALLKGPLFSFYLFCNMCYETFCFISWMWDTVLKYFVLKNKY